MNLMNFMCVQLAMWQWILLGILAAIVLISAIIFLYLVNLIRLVKTEKLKNKNLSAKVGN